MSRCVDQRFLLSKYTENERGKSYRQDWIERRLLLLGDVFAIDLLSFAVMDNHVHSVLHINFAQAEALSSIEVLKRWSRVGKVSLLCQVYMESNWREGLTEGQLSQVLEEIAVYRNKLCDISTFMSKLNSYIAHRANKEDGRKGHFWDSRFKSQALLDAQAVLACMAYVDLNPIRAGKARSLKTSPHTSIKRRLLNSSKAENSHLLPFSSSFVSTGRTIVEHISLGEYVSFIKTVLSAKAQKSCEHLAFAERNDNWITIVLEFETVTNYAAGEAEFVNHFEKQIRRNNQKKNTAIQTLLR